MLGNYLIGSSNVEEGIIPKSSNEKKQRGYDRQNGIMQFPIPEVAYCVG